MLFWHVPAPNEALLISGSRRKSQETQFRICHGPRVFRPTDQAEGALSFSVSTRIRDRRGLHHDSRDSPPHKGHSGIQGR